jgi:hypothetical protein
MKYENREIKMNKMWEALEQYQRFAERHEFGAAWKRMTTERTADAASAAAAAASRDASWAAVRAADAAKARDAELTIAMDVAWAAAIKYINKAIAEEMK